METTPALTPSQPEAPTLPRCLNCDTALLGPFCHACGQEGVDRNVPLGHLLREALGDLFAFDGRFARTLHPLLTRPGRLTTAFIAGHRAPYVPPIRLYVFSSFLLFLVVSLLNFDPNRLIDTPDAAASAQQVNGAARGDSVRAAVATEIDSLRSALGQMATPDTASTDTSGDGTVRLGGQDVSDSWIARLIMGRAERIEQDPSAFVRHLMSRVPLFLFLLVPIFALELKLLYLRRKVLYVQHLVFALHVHAFAFVLIAVVMALSRVWSPFALGYWLIPVYVLLAMRHVYRQAWAKTMVKALGVAFLHFWTTSLAATLYVVLLTLFF